MEQRKDNLPYFFCNSLSNDNNELLNFVQVGWDKCTANSSFSHYRDMYIIHFIKSGAGIIETNGKKYILSENSAFIVRPKILTVQKADVLKPWELYFFAFNGRLAEKLIKKTIFADDIVSVHMDGEELCEHITDIAIELNDSDVNDMHKYECFFKLLSYFDKNASQFSIYSGNSGYMQDIVSKVQNYIQLNYEKSITISDLSEQINISRSHLFRIYKAVTGSSIKEYIVAVRMNEARSLLSDTNYTAAVVASLVGYSHYTTFFKMFKDYTGYSPQEYRRIEKNKLKRNKNK